MPFTVREFRDLVQLLEQRPEWRDELRRLVLTDELLALPQIVRELAEAQGRTEETVRTLAERMEQLARRVDSLAEAQARTEEAVRELSRHIDQLGRRIDVLVETQIKMGSDLEKLKGSDLERRYRERAPSYFRPLVQRGHTLTYDELYRVLDQAIARGQLSKREADEIELADAIVRGRSQEDEHPIYLVVEVSWGVGTEDVRRASERAALLSKAGTRAIPVVAGDWVTTAAEAMALSWKVWQVTDGHVVGPEPA